MSANPEISNKEALKEEILNVLRPAWDAIHTERDELIQKYTDAKNAKNTPRWIISARKAESDFANAIIKALPNFIFNKEECDEIATNKNFIHLCWIEWNTYAQEEYEKGHDINSVEDVMDIVGDTITLSKFNQ